MPIPTLAAPPATLGQQETELLRFVAAQVSPVSVGDAESGFGDPSNLSRSTVKTVLERLHRKGFLERLRRADGVFVYRSCLPERELMGSLVGRFVERTLAGSLDPFLAYFADNSSGRLSEAELAELQRLVQKLQPSAPSEKTEGEPPA
ncbi:MAG: BlaI/MecI/CopY family transcriptional regulator [Armatimonadetes bacterium]|nr:BlaI/MecI/CopY family transcriptional regulator [Armatimonadota bacterium]